MEKQATIDCEYFHDSRCRGAGVELRDIGCKNSRKDACCYTCSLRQDCTISCDFLETRASALILDGPLVRVPPGGTGNEYGEYKVSQIGWGRSFFLAFASLIVGFLIALVWILVYIFIRYGLYIHYHEPYFLYYPGAGASVDWSWLILDSILSVISPFISFSYVPDYQNGWSSPFVMNTPIFDLPYIVEADIVGTIEILARLAISFLVYASFFVPTIKFSLKETNRNVSWFRAFLLGIKSAFVGIILGTLFLLLGVLFLFAVFVGVSQGSTGASAPLELNLNMLIGAAFLVLIVIAIIVVLIYTATGATIIRYTTREASRVKKGTGWGRSFFVSLKASVVAMLWTMLFGLLFGVFLIVAIVGSIESQSMYAFGTSMVAILVFLVIVIVLSELSPTASIIKYLVEEIDKNLRLEKEELELEQKPRAQRLKGRNCGDCSHYLTSKCPRNYSHDEPVWRTQKPCELFEDVR